MILGIHGFCFAVIDSRSGTPNIPLGLTWMILGPSLVTWVFMGSVLLPSILETMMPNFGCQSGPPQALRRFGLVMMRAWMNRISSFCNLKMLSIGSDYHILGVGANLLKPCQSKHPQAVRRFGLVMMTAWMNMIRPFCNLKMVSIGSDAQIWVSE